MVHGDETKPDGQQVFDLLLKASDLPLNNEPLCNMKSVAHQNSSISLGQHLSTVFSLSYETENTLTIKSSCDKSKFETSNKELIDIWDCKVEALEENVNKEFISSAVIAFATDLHKKSVISGSLRCF